MARTVEDVFEKFFNELHYNEEKFESEGITWLFTYVDGTESNGRRPDYDKKLDSANCAQGDSVEHLYFENGELAVWHFRDATGLHIRDENGDLLCNPRGEGKCENTPGPAIGVDDCKWCQYGQLTLG